MPKEVQFRRGTSSEHVDGAGFTGAIAEVTVDTTNNTLRVHDGSTKGGNELVGVAATQRVINKDIVASQLIVSGISTLSTLTSLNVSGLSTFAGITTVTGDTLFTKQLNVSGVSTFAGITTVTGSTLFAKQLNVSGVSTFAGITTVTGDTLFTKQLNVSGVTTITGNLNAPGNYFVKLARLTNQTITNGVDTVIGLSTISDTNSWYSGITTRTTPTVAGTYQVQGMVNWQAGSITNNQTNIQLRKNATTFAISQVGIQTFAYTMSVCGIVTMNGTTDFIDFTAFTGNTTSQVVVGIADASWTKLEMFKIN